jgi:hypothetical protein
MEIECRADAFATIGSTKAQGQARPSVDSTFTRTIPMTNRTIAAVALLAGGLTAAAGIALAAQDKYSVSVPNGLAFAEFRGFESWQAIAASQTGSKIEVILGNPAMIAAYEAGVPGNGQHFPDGARMAKIHWNAKKSAEAPAPTTVPDTLHDIDFMVRDSARFADSGGWGYAQFNYNAATDTFTPLGAGAKCGYACHTIVKAKDYVFTAYGKR